MRVQIIIAFNRAYSTIAKTDNVTSSKIHYTVLKKLANDIQLHFVKEDTQMTSGDGRIQSGKKSQNINRRGELIVIY